MTEEIKEERGEGEGYRELLVQRVMAEGMALVTGGRQVMPRQPAMPGFALGKGETFPLHPARLISDNALLLRSWKMSCLLGSRQHRRLRVLSPNLRDAGSCLSCHRSSVAQMGAHMWL